MSKKIKKVKQNKYPSRIACQKCSVKKGVRPDVFEKRMEEYGSKTQLLLKYTCTKCRKEHNLDKFGALKTFKPTRAKKAQGNHAYDAEGKYILPEWMKHPKHQRVGCGPEHYVPLTPKETPIVREMFRTLTKSKTSPKKTVAI